MGNLAASGGYYISCGADKIYANPATLTGSIGVFGIMPNFQDALKNWLGITFDGVNTNKYSDFGSAVRPLSQYEEDVIRFYIEDIYETFISHIAEGRNMTKEAVDSIGQGRVWSGVDAKQIGLIDEFGGLEDAIKEAAKMAEIEDYRVNEMPTRKEFINQLIEDLTNEMGTSTIEKELGENYTYFKYMNKLADMDRYQARMPFFVEVK
jgi:protease-4